jgi:hypothetical protein
MALMRETWFLTPSRPTPWRSAASCAETPSTRTILAASMTGESTFSFGDLGERVHTSN